ncbi:MAG: right-handed parallel beta-helix repeat-containing protein [Paludibacter sp.]|nr:right-handed parallel beta-helix repeat-containing protein [Paludibacter sp.]
MKKFKIILFFIFLSPNFFAAINVYPTFESCGIYISYKENAKIQLFYKKACETIWIEAYPPIYDNVTKEFRGSIVKLEEDTEYEVKAEIYDNNSMNKTIQSTVFKTWKSNVKVRHTIPLKKFKTKNTFIINGLKGSENNWIKITGVDDIDLSNSKENAAIHFSNCNYVILEGVTIKCGSKNGILIDKTNTNIRIVNCDISGWGRTTNVSTEEGDMIDSSTQKPINWDAGIRIEQALNILVERCYIHDPKGLTNPWTGKILVGDFKGKSYDWLHPKGMNGIYIRDAQGGIVIRYNDIIGSQPHRFNDPIETAQNGELHGGFNRDADIYGNVLAFGQDDGIELDGAQCNIRMYNNRIEQVYCGISLAPNRRGPSYIFNNVVFNLGDSEDNVGVSIKNGGGMEYSQGRQFLFNNTLISRFNGMNGSGFGKGNINRDMFTATTRNNIFLSETDPSTNIHEKGKSISDKQKSEHNDFDYDMIGNLALTGGKGVILAKDGAEKHGIFASPEFADFDHADFTIKASDPGMDKGIVIPNFTTSYNGNAPDIGAFEYGAESSLIPVRPLNISANKYSVNLKLHNEEVVTFKVGEIGSGNRIIVKKSNDMHWLHTELSTTEIKSNSVFTLKLKATEADSRQIGMIIIRLENGFSIPISVKVL